MTTSDGILARDWNQVKDLAAKIANAVCVGDEQQSSRTTKDLIRLLRDLENKYGRLPSIMATRADYTEDHGKSARLLEAAYKRASSINDNKNMTFIASSLAEKYINDMGEYRKGAHWLSVLGQRLKCHFDNSEQKVYRSLKRKLRRLGVGKPLGQTTQRH